MEILFIEGYTSFFVRKDQVAGAWRENNALVLLMVNGSTPCRIPMAGRESANAALLRLQAFMETR